MSDVIPVDAVSHDFLAKGRAAGIIGRQERVSLTLSAAAIAACDLVGCAAVSATVFYLHGITYWHDSWQLVAGVIGFLALWSVAATSQALYGKAALVSRGADHAFRGLVVCALTFGLMLLLGFALQVIQGASRIWLLSWALSAFAWVGSVRLIWSGHLDRMLRHGRCIERAIVIAESDTLARSVADEVQRESRGEIRVISVGDIGHLGQTISIDAIDDAIKRGLVDRVLLAGSTTTIERSQPLLDRLACLAVDVTLIPNISGLRRIARKVDYIGQLPSIDVGVRPLSGLQAALKRAEDLVLASLILLLACPMFLLVAIAIKLDSPGPIIFRQLREGFHGRTFKVWKFRTMRDDAADPDARIQTSRDDPRVTRVGRILRRTSIDELPQFLNVLLGDMSIVGPRPHALGMTAFGLPVADALKEYAARHRLKPGITGWAQVNGCRGEVQTQEKLSRRVALDCYYIDHWSLSLDLMIIAQTATLLVFDRFAY